MWILTLILIVVIAVYLIKSEKSSSIKTDEALDIARRRYASGEIAKEQFEEIKKNLA